MDNRILLQTAQLLALIAALALIITATARAATLFEARQAESASPLPTGTFLYDDPQISTSGYDAVVYEDNATINYNYTVGANRTLDQIAVNARQSTASKGAVDIALVINGQLQEAQTIPRSATSYQLRTWSVNLGPGTHTIGVRGAGLKGADKLHTDYLRLSGQDDTPPPDTTPLDTTITSLDVGTNGNYNDVTFSATATEPATFQFKIDGDPTSGTGWVNLGGSPPWQLANIGDGNHNLHVRSTDAAGNTDPTPATRPFTITPPPLPDADGDGVSDDVDQCDNEPGPASNNGCPVQAGYSPLPTCPAPTLNTRIANATAGSTITLPETCAFREHAAVNKALTIVGGHIRGSDVWTSWNTSGGNWVSSQTVPAAGTQPSDFSCESGTSECARPEQVFVEGELIEQLPSGTDPGANQWALDSTRHVVLGFDPTGKDIEVSTRQKWMSLKASGIVVDGIEARHAENGAGYHGAMFSETGGVTLKNCEVAYAHGTNVSFNHGDNMRVENCDIHHGGQQNYHFHHGSVDLVNNEMYGGNHARYNSGWEAGNGKGTYQEPGTIWSGNEVYNNRGTGLWCDIDCDGVIIENNRVHHNFKSGVFYEVSQNGILRNNVIWENGWGSAANEQAWAAALRTTSSDNVEIYGNVVAWNSTGIAAIKTDVSAWNHLPQTMTNIYIHDNIVMLERVASSEGQPLNSCSRSHAMAWCQTFSYGFFSGKNNRALNNRYYYTFAEESTWPRWFLSSQGYATIEAWNNAPAENGATYLTVAGKDQIAAQYNIPANP